MMMRGGVELRALGTTSLRGGEGSARFGPGTSLRKRFSTSGDSGPSARGDGLSVSTGPGGAGNVLAAGAGGSSAAARVVSPAGRPGLEAAFAGRSGRDDGMQQQQLPLLGISHTGQHNAETGIQDKYKEYQNALEKLRGRNRGSAAARRTSWVFTSLIVIVLAVLIIVIIYLFTNSKASETSVSVREICNSENLEVCMQGLIDQLRDDSTAALRSPIHYLFTVGAFTATLFLYLCLYKRRRLVRQRLLSSLPNNSVDLWMGGRDQDRRPYQTTPFNSEIYSCIFERLQRAILARNFQLFVAENEVVVGNTPTQDLNWGYVDGTGVGRKGANDASRVNYKRYTAKSYEFVSELAAQQNPAYKIHSWETVRDYMGRLKTLCKPPDRATAISEQHCDEFVALYEQARFSGATFDSSKWDLVRRNLHYFHQYFAPQQPLSALS